MKFLQNLTKIFMATNGGFTGALRLKFLQKGSKPET